MQYLHSIRQDGNDVSQTFCVNCSTPLPTLRFCKRHQKRLHPQWQAKSSVQRLWPTIHQRPSEQSHQRWNQSLDWQTATGKDSIGGHCQSHWCFRGMATRLCEWEICSWVRRLDRQIGLNDSTVPYGSGYHDWWEKHYLFPWRGYTTAERPITSVVKNGR